MSHSPLFLALVLSLLPACIVDAEPVGDGASHRAASRCDGCADEVVVRAWRARDREVALWPRDTRRATVIFTPGATADSFVAYGVADATTLLWAYHASARDYADVIGANAGEWGPLSASITDFDSAMLGSFNKPKPKGPVVGEPPSTETVTAVLDAAAGAADVSEVLTADLDARP